MVDNLLLLENFFLFCVINCVIVLSVLLVRDCLFIEFEW